MGSCLCKNKRMTTKHQYLHLFQIYVSNDIYTSGYFTDMYFLSIKAFFEKKKVMKILQSQIQDMYASGSIATYEPNKKAIFFIHDSQGGNEIGTIPVCRQWRVIYDASD